MNSKEAILEAMAGHRTAVPPAAVFTQSATMDLMDRTGCSWPEAHSDPDRMVGLALGISRFCGMYSARVPFCVSAEAERLGCRVRIGGRTAGPMVVASPYAPADRSFGTVVDPPELMSEEEFSTGGRTAVILAALEKLHRQHGGDLAVVAGVTGPLTLLTQLLGAEPMLYSMVTAPASIRAWMVRLEPLLSGYIQRLSDAGADIVQMAEASASPDLIAPVDFRRFAGDYLGCLTGVKGAYTSLHICGEATAIIENMVLTGVDALSLDSHVDPLVAAAVVHGRAVLIGNVGPIRALMTGTPTEVKQDARAAATAGFGIIAPGCGIPVTTPTANLQALAHYAEKD
ncbi:MAG: uroporphyrinogen decarboxylase family protein [Candidatus Methanomethylophilus sp.]|nr:uroporphyrinogen decarboxylase family protein [Methanomethylophilus sp.]